MSSESTQEEWAVVEILGHRSHAGRISELNRFGAHMLRIEVPRADGAFDELIYSGAAIFGMRRCSEAVAREAAARARGEWAAPQLKGPAGDVADAEEGDYF